MATGKPSSAAETTRAVALTARPSNRAIVRTSWLVLLVAVYLSLDVANPLMPGALTLGADESVEVRQAERLRVRDQIATLRTATPPPHRLEPVDDGVAVGRMVVRLRVTT